MFHTSRRHTANNTKFFSDHSDFIGPFKKEIFGEGEGGVLCWLGGQQAVPSPHNKLLEHVLGKVCDQSVNS